MKKKQERFEIRRPIIFICNEFYAKAVKSLRDATIPVKITEADSTRLLQRLRLISKCEQVNVQDDILKYLCESTGNDVRSAITQLQFLQHLAHEGKQLSLKSLQDKYKDNNKLHEGTKDQFQSIF